MEVDRYIVRLEGIFYSLNKRNAGGNRTDCYLSINELFSGIKDELDINEDLIDDILRKLHFYLLMNTNIDFPQNISESRTIETIFKKLSLEFNIYFSVVVKEDLWKYFAETILFVNSQELSNKLISAVVESDMKFVMDENEIFKITLLTLTGLNLSFKNLNENKHQKFVNFLLEKLKSYHEKISSDLNSSESFRNFGIIFANILSILNFFLSNWDSYPMCIEVNFLKGSNIPDLKVFYQITNDKEAILSPQHVSNSKFSLVGIFMNLIEILKSFIELISSNVFLSWLEVSTDFLQNKYIDIWHKEAVPSNVQLLIGDLCFDSCIYLESMGQYMNREDLNKETNQLFSMLKTFSVKYDRRMELKLETIDPENFGELINNASGWEKEAYLDYAVQHHMPRMLRSNSTLMCLMASCNKLHKFTSELLHSVVDLLINEGELSSELEENLKDFILNTVGGQNVESQRQILFEYLTAYNIASPLMKRNYDLEFTQVLNKVTHIHERNANKFKEKENKFINLCLQAPQQTIEKLLDEALAHSGIISVILDIFFELQVICKFTLLKSENVLLPETLLGSLLSDKLKQFLRNEKFEKNLLTFLNELTSRDYSYCHELLYLTIIPELEKGIEDKPCLYTKKLVVTSNILLTDHYISTLHMESLKILSLFYGQILEQASMKLMKIEYSAEIKEEILKILAKFKIRLLNFECLIAFVITEKNYSYFFHLTDGASLHQYLLNKVQIVHDTKERNNSNFYLETVNYNELVISVSSIFYSLLRNEWKELVIILKQEFIKKLNVERSVLLDSNKMCDESRGSLTALKILYDSLYLCISDTNSKPNEKEVVEYFIQNVISTLIDESNLLFKNIQNFELEYKIKVLMHLHLLLVEFLNGINPAYQDHFTMFQMLVLSKILEILSFENHFNEFEMLSANIIQLPHPMRSESAKKMLQVAVN